ncbi:MAG: IPTL-CTERM sorting domain-containing protein [Lysobacterales bacterium]
MLSIFKSRLSGLGVVMLVLALPGQAFAQFYSCSSNLTMDTVGGGPYYIDEAITIEMVLEATTVQETDGGGLTTPGFLEIQEFDFKPDCDGGDFFSCAAAGNTVIIDPDSTGFGGTCGTDFTVSPVGDGVTFRFVPTDTLRIASGDNCTVTFDIEVQGVAPGNEDIFETGGWAETQTLCTGPDPFTPYPGVEGASASSSLSFTLSTLRTSFRVTKDFTDDSDAETEVFLRCNSGLPLEQSFTLGDEEWVEFVVRDFVTGTTDCTVSEEPVPVGYEADYTADFEPGAIFGSVSADEDGCYYNDLTGGAFTCDVTNSIDEVRIEVNKEWLVSSNSTLDIDFVAQADYTCYNVYDSPAGGTLLPTLTGTLDFDGEYDTQFISGLYPAADGSSYCTVSEPDLPDYVEADISDCAEVPVERGASCTLYNSVFFEGIPTLSQYGLALLSLLMLGMGVIAVRRFA